MFYNAWTLLIPIILFAPVSPFVDQIHVIKSGGK